MYLSSECKEPLAPSESELNLNFELDTSQYELQQQMLMEKFTWIHLLSLHCSAVRRELHTLCLWHQNNHNRQNRINMRSKWLIVDLVEQSSWTLRQIENYIDCIFFLFRKTILMWIKVQKSQNKTHIDIYWVRKNQKDSKNEGNC